MSRIVLDELLNQRAEDIIKEVLGIMYKSDLNFVDLCLTKVREADHWYMKEIFENKEKCIRILEASNDQT
jgi:hypothetical protein